MRKIVSFVAYAGVLFFVTLLPVAASDLSCNASPAEGEVDTVFEIFCEGFSPNTHVFGYLVYPGGTASAHDNEWNTFQGRTNEMGAIHFSFKTRYFDSYLKYEATATLGEWALVVEQLGAQRAVVQRGIARWRVSGKNEGVSGASLSADPALVYKPKAPFTHRRSRTADFVGVFNRANRAETSVMGNGFLPNEIVTVWIELPHGGCDPWTGHRDLFFKFFFYSRQFIGNERIDFPNNLHAASVLRVGNVKADEGGSLQIRAFFGNADCEGNWHVVARGNTSGRGGETIITLMGYAVEENAALRVTPTIVRAMGETMLFHGDGFLANEPIFCWVASPQGQAIPTRYDAHFSGVSDFGAIVERDNQIHASARGSFQFEITTGAYRVIIDGLDHGKPYYDERFRAWQSEGALGEWAMTCRGFDSERTAIARFTLVGGMIDP